MPAATELARGATDTGGNSLDCGFRLYFNLRVFPTACRAETISDLADSGMECLSLTVDDPANVKACHEEVSRLVGSDGLDYLFNNAGGIYQAGPNSRNAEEARKRNKGEKRSPPRLASVRTHGSRERWSDGRRKGD